MLSGVGGPHDDAATADSGPPIVAPPRGLQASDFAPLWETSSEKEWTELITTLIHQYGADAVEKWKHTGPHLLLLAPASKTSVSSGSSKASTSSVEVEGPGSSSKQSCGAGTVGGATKTSESPGATGQLTVGGSSSSTSASASGSGAAAQQKQQKPYNVFEPSASTAAPDLNQGSRIIHLCVLKNFPALLHTLVCDYDFDVDITRDSDRNTAMHLALFETRKKDMVEKLDYLGADLTRKNAYGIECEKAFQAFQNSKENIIFLDLELTKGFYEGEDEVGIPRRIMELACVITDKNLRELGRGSWVIGGFSKEFLLTLPYFHQKNFRDSGHGREFEPIREARTGYAFYGNDLFSDMIDPNKAVSLETAESECLALIKEYCPEGACPLSGNSIQCDREILYTETPSIYHYLSHRIIDVSSFLGVAERWMPHKIEMWRAHQRQVSNYNHRALDDTLSSIQSMAWIRENMLLPADHKLAEWEAEKAWEEEERWQGSEDEEDEEEDDGHHDDGTGAAYDSSLSPNKKSQYPYTYGSSSSSTTGPGFSQSQYGPTSAAAAAKGNGKWDGGSTYEQSSYGKGAGANNQFNTEVQQGGGIKGNHCGFFPPYRDKNFASSSLTPSGVPGKNVGGSASWGGPPSNKGAYDHQQAGVAYSYSAGAAPGSLSFSQNQQQHSAGGYNSYSGAWGGKGGGGPPGKPRSAGGSRSPIKRVGPQNSYKHKQQNDGDGQRMRSASENVSSYWNSAAGAGDANFSAWDDHYDYSGAGDFSGVVNLGPWGTPGSSKKSRATNGKHGGSGPPSAKGGSSPRSGPRTEKRKGSNDGAVWNHKK